MKKSIGPGTVLYPTPVLVVGTYDAQGKPNVMTAAWGGICCSRPPCVSIALRKATHTYGNIVGQGAFTISIPSEKYAREADFVGVVSGRNRDKFAEAKLTPVASTLVNAPYVAEFPIVLECKLIHRLELGLHTLFVGEVLDVKVETSCLSTDGIPQIDRVRPILFAPSEARYYGLGAHIGKSFSIGKEI